MKFSSDASAGVRAPSGVRPHVNYDASHERKIKKKIDDDSASSTSTSSTSSSSPTPTSTSSTSSDAAHQPYANRSAADPQPYASNL